MDWVKRLENKLKLRGGRWKKGVNAWIRCFQLDAPLCTLHMYFIIKNPLKLANKCIHMAQKLMATNEIIFI